MSNSRMMSSALSDVSRVSNVSTRTFGFRSWIRAVQDLALQVGLVDHVEVYEPERPDPRSGEVERGRRPEPACPDEQHARRLELPLSLDAHIGKDEMARIAQDLFVRQFGEDGRSML